METESGVDRSEFFVTTGDVFQQLKKKGLTLKEGVLLSMGKLHSFEQISPTEWNQAFCVHLGDGFEPQFRTEFIMGETLIYPTKITTTIGVRIQYTLFQSVMVRDWTFTL